jgi:hypothetical protein
MSVYRVLAGCEGLLRRRSSHNLQLILGLMQTSSYQLIQASRGSGKVPQRR